MLFVDKYNRRYSKFFKQLQRCKNTEEELAIINYILFSYCEDYFISPKVEKDILEKLKRLMEKHPVCCLICLRQLMNNLRQ